jgi:hypothetical protein
VSKGRFTCTQCKQDFHDHCVNLRCPIGYHNLLSRQELDDAERAAVDAGTIALGAADPLEDRINAAYLLGTVAAMEDIVPKLSKRSGEAYAAHRDDEAVLLRDLATSFKEAAEAERAKYNVRKKQWGL